jgi:hypothetical protein
VLTLPNTIVRDLRPGDWPHTVSLVAELDGKVVRERLGEANGLWRDVLLLERRSDLVG